MQDGQFEWDDAKAAANVVKHGVWFETARDVLEDPLFLERIDILEAYGEERSLAVGRSEVNCWPSYTRSVASAFV